MVRVLWSFSKLGSSTALSQAVTSGKGSSEPLGTRIAASILKYAVATVILQKTLEQLIESIHFLSSCLSTRVIIQWRLWRRELNARNFRIRPIPSLSQWSSTFGKYIDKRKSHTRSVWRSRRHDDTRAHPQQCTTCLLGGGHPRKPCQHPRFLRPRLQSARRGQPISSYDPRGTSRSVGASQQRTADRPRQLVIGNRGM